MISEATDRRDRCSPDPKMVPHIPYELARCFHIAVRSLDQLHICFTFDLTVIEEVALNCNPSFAAIMSQWLDCWVRGFADLRWRTLIAYHWVAVSKLKTRTPACQRDPPTITVQLTHVQNSSHLVSRSFWNLYFY
jgi:hypothetical protein